MQSIEFAVPDRSDIKISFPSYNYLDFLSNQIKHLEIFAVNGSLIDMTDFGKKL